MAGNELVATTTFACRPGQLRSPADERRHISLSPSLQPMRLPMTHQEGVLEEGIDGAADAAESPADALDAQSEATCSCARQLQERAQWHEERALR